MDFTTTLYLIESALPTPGYGYTAIDLGAFFMVASRMVSEIWSCGVDMDWGLKEVDIITLPT